MKGLRAFGLGLGLIVGGTCRAEAHAFVDHAEPKVGSAVAVSPHAIKIWFTRHLKPGESVIKIFDGGGHEVDQRDVKIDANDAKLMSVSVPELQAGTYKVEWTAVCMDGHTTHASFTFMVTPR